MIRNLFFICFSMVLCVSGCELYPQDDYQEYYSVEAYLVANRSLPQVRVTHTLPADEEYLLEKAAVNDADVEIRLLDGNGAVEETYGYILESNGIYRSLNAEQVLPQRRYELNVALPQRDENITAQTLVPGSFNMVGEVVDSMAYQSSEQIRVTTTRSYYPGRQAYFIFTVNVVDPSRENLTPFYRDQIEENDGNIGNLYVNSSGIINEQNYDVNEGDNTLTLRLPWLAVAFYGDNDITANAIDDNMYDFLRSQSVQSGGSTLPPGEIQNVRYNVTGGIGIFGSLATDTVRVYIKEQTETSQKQSDSNE